MRYISLTREGWYYLIVLAFIVGGAVLREVNLLVILAGMMIGPLLFNWRWATASLASLSIERKLPKSIAVGDPLIVEFDLFNHRRRLTSYAVVVSDQLVRLEPPAVEPPTVAQTIAPAIRPEQGATADYRCLITRRGKYEFGPLSLSTRFPLGLVVSNEPVESHATLLVCPRVGRMTRKWEQWIDADRAGAQRTSSRRGLVEGDYYGMREWRAGDSQRWIHWRTSARLNELAVRQFEEQRNGDVAILLDLWLPPNPSDGQLGNAEVVVSLGATAVSDLSRRGTNVLSIAVHGSEIAHWSAPASTAFCQDVLERLAVVSATSEDRLQLAVQQLIENAPPGTRLIVFSTRTIDLEQLLGELAPASAPHSQIAVARSLWVDVTREDLSSLFVLDR
jgi:uncharacterized protein (DUF58 family)